MLCTAQAEEEAPPEVETTPSEQALGAAEDECDQAERLQAQRTAAEEAETAAAAAAPLAASLWRLALATLLQDRLSEHSPATEDGVRLLDLLPVVVLTVAAAQKVMEQAEAESGLQTAMIGSTRAHSEARSAVSYAEHMEELATEATGRQRRQMGWSAEKATAISSEAAVAAKQLVQEDNEARLEVTRAEARATQTGLCSECILHRMRLAPANVHPSQLLFYEPPLDRCVHGGSTQAGVAGLELNSGGWHEGDSLGWRQLQWP